MNALRSNFVVTLIIFFLACSAQPKKKKLNVENKFNEAFKSYWFQGNAEITSYDLKQARYGEIRNGEAVLVFVTEDFLLQKQVKKESSTSEKASSVLKLNFVRKFPTGIYDYSMMTSTFTPIHDGIKYSPLKLTSSSQEWCGHSWLQLNQLKDSGYKVKSFSYFEAEGDETKELSDVVLEDGLLASIRINPDNILTGEQKILPSAHYLRFAHQPIKAYKASVAKLVNKDDRFKGENLQVLKVTYPELNRNIEIIYEKDFPHYIVGWKEKRDSWGKELETIATVKGKLKSAYWGQNSVEDNYLRDSLLLK